jgi:superfamily II DNA or RNA helicase
MRDVKSRNYFEQMKGRGTRTLDHDDLWSNFVKKQLVPQDPDDEPASVLLARIRAERNPVSPKRRRKARAEA